MFNPESMQKKSRTPEEIRKNSERANADFGETSEGDGTKEKDSVFPTAFMTARCFAEQTQIPNAKELYKIFLEKSGLEKEINALGDIRTPHFMELRYLMTEKILRSSLENGEISQVIELASGFTPHSINMLSTEQEIETYIENDFAVNLKMKQLAVNDFISGIPVVFIPGNVVDSTTWSKFEGQLEDKPVGIFCEGLMMYLSRDAQVKLLKNVKELLTKYGGYFMHEDILKYHPELKENPRFNRITSQLKKVSGAGALDESFSQEDITKFYEEQGFSVERVEEKAELSIDTYPEDVREDAVELLNAGFKMWKLSLPKEK